MIIGTVSGKQPIPQVPYYEDPETLRPSKVIPDDTNGEASIPPVQTGCLTAVSNILMRAFVGAYTSRYILLDDALLKGAGIDLTWSTLWDYTTINAKGAQSWLQDHFIRTNGFMHYKDQMDKDAFMDVFFAWAAAHTPIALQQGIVDVNDTLRSGIQINNTVEYASTRAHAYLLRGIEHIQQGLDQRRISTNPFAIGHNWDKPTMGKQ